MTNLLKDFRVEFMEMRKDRTRAQDTERGLDGIQTRICYRRRVLCSRYTTGPERFTHVLREL